MCGIDIYMHINPFYIQYKDVTYANRCYRCNVNHCSNTVWLEFTIALLGLRNGSPYQDKGETKAPSR